MSGDGMDAGNRVMTVKPDGTVIYTPFAGYEVEYPAVGSCTAPTAVNDLAASRVAASVHLGWTDSGADVPEIHRSVNDPYFVPSGSTLLATTAGTTYADPDEIGDPATSHYYVVVARNECGTTAVASNRIGEFDYSIFVTGTSSSPNATSSSRTAVALTSSVAIRRIERVTLSLGGQLVGVHVTAYDAANGGNEVTTSDTGLFYFYTDHLGSVGAISDANGAVQGDIIRYEPFGQLRSSAPSSVITDRGYTGHKENREIGLTYMNARYYVAEIGRFASADTIVPDPMNPQSFNRYSYVLNNPLKFTDPTGHYAAIDEGSLEPGPNPFDEEIPATAGDGYAQAAWERMWWATWTGNEELAEAYAQEARPYIMGGWQPGDAWGAWAYSQSIKSVLIDDFNEAFGYLFMANLGAGASLNDFFAGGNVPKASALLSWAQGQGWQLKKNPFGPYKFVDSNGIVRLTLKQGSLRAPGSGYPHVEIRNASGHRVDPFGNLVTRKSPGNHTPIDWDL